MKRLRRLCLTLAMATGLSLAATSVSTAAPEATPAQNSSAAPAAVLAWFKVPGMGNTVYMLGPKGWQYQLLNEAHYFALWGTWDGIHLDGRVPYQSTVMWDVELAKKRDDP